MYKRDIYLDIDDNLNNYIKSVELDSNSRVWHFHLTVDYEPLDLTGKSVHFRAEKPDKTNVLNDCKIVDAEKGVVEVKLTRQVNAIPGRVKCLLKIIGDEGFVLKTKTFVVDVSKALSDDAIVSSDEFGALEAALGKVQDIDNRFAQTNAQLDNIALISVDMFGAKGDGVSNDTNAIKNAFLKLNDGYKIKFGKNKTYLIDSPIITNITNSKNISIDFNGSTIKLIKPQTYYGSGLLGFKFDKSLADTVTEIKNGKFDLSVNTPNFSEGVLDTELLGGGGVIHLYGSRLINIDNLYFTDVFFSSAINILYSDTININNCKGDRVGGMASFAEGDRAGDGIYLGKLGVYNDTPDSTGGDDSLNKEVEVTIKNCSFSSWEAIENTFPDNNMNGCRSGRCGVVVGEYSQNLKNKKIKIENCRFNNYQRVFHIEYTSNWDIIIENCDIYNFGDCLFASHDKVWNSIICKNVSFSKDIDVRGMYKHSGYVYFSQMAEEHKTRNLIKFENCRFTNKVKMFFGLTKTDVVVDTSKITVERLDINNSRCVFRNSDILANRGVCDSSIISMYTCNVEMGYLNDDNSNYFFGSSGAGNTNKIYGDLSRFDNCIFKNTNFAFNNNNRVRITNCKYVIDNNFTPKTDLNVSMDGIIYLGFKDILETFENNVVINDRTDTTSINLINWTLSPETLLNKISIKNNKFKGCWISTSTVGDYVLDISNNIFDKDNKNIPNFIKTTGGNIIAKENIFIGLTSNELLTSGLLLNNHRQVDSTLIEI